MKKYALVIGANGHLGQAVVQELDRLGYTIDSTWNSDDHPDASDHAAYMEMPPRIDILAYLAGVNVVEPSRGLQEAAWHRVMDVNLTGAYLACRASYEALRATQGTIVTISSIMATHPYPCRAAYAASKAGLEGLTRALAVEWGIDGISAVCLRLGHMTSLMGTTPPQEGLLEAVKAASPLGRIIEPEEVAGYIGFLAEGGARALTGSVVTIDGGYSASRWPLPRVPGRA